MKKTRKRRHKIGAGGRQEGERRKWQENEAQTKGRLVEIDGRENKEEKENQQNDEE